ncbi:DUF2655 domain-containing protein [Pantoea sp. RIT413]|nr:DUF2655 domain-containing protein [Pantoea sp. RIT 413]RBO11883.1 DUF2655 domain-containing protein [Pantoea sp. 3_1284]
MFENPHIPVCCPGRNPQPAKCLIKHHVLRHCSVLVLSGKLP